MDYKQKYEEALERCKKEFNFNNLAYSHEEIKQRLEYVFPELKESEDENMRKFINHELVCLRAIDEKGSDRYNELTEAIDWLEMQGEHQQFLNKIQVGDELTKNERGQLVNLSQLERVAKPRNKQKGEQKPANKVEPKFRSGDFITDGERIFQIEKTVWERNNRNDGITYCESFIVNLRDGYTYADNTDLKKYHLWTIQDVKDGDVLVTHLSPEGDWIGMYKESTGDTFKTHCYLSAVGEFVINPNRCKNHGTYGLHPATKEQRDILFQEMKEAGYEWDAEKKELKKIEQKPAEWSEEDEILSQCLINEQEEALNKMNNNKYGHSEIISDLKEMYIERIDWLKSLKERMKG